MKRLTLLLLFLLLTAGSLAAADWLIGAEYRLEVRKDSADKVCAIDLRRLLLPEPLTHGVVVTDTRQEPQNFYLDDRQCLFLPPSPAGTYYIYFGFSQPTRKDCWDRQKHGPLPQNQMLTVRLLHAWNLWPSEAEWLQKRKEYINRRYTNSINYWTQKALYWQGLANAAPGFFMQYSHEQWIHLQFYHNEKRQLERYNRFKSFASRAQTWRFRRNPRHRRPPAFWCGYWMKCWLPTVQRHNTLYRVRSTIIGIRKSTERWRDELAQLAVTRHGAPERELVEQFSKPKIRVFGSDVAREINLPKRAFDAGGTFACSYTGALFVPQTGEWEFGITSNSLTMLKLGEELITIRSGKSAPDAVECKTIRRKLPKGLYPFALYYLKTQVTTHLTMTWKAPSSTTHAIINDMDFRPALPLHPTGLISRKKARYPVVDREDRQDLFYGKLHKAEFSSFKVLAPENLRYHWLINGEKISGDCTRLVLPDNPVPRVQFVPEDRRYQPLPVSHCPPIGTRLAVDSGLWIHPVLPVTLKHDEVLSGSRELRSRLPVPVCVRLRTRVTGGTQNTFKTETSYIQLEGKLPEELDRFAEDKTHKKTLPLSGKDLVQGVRVEWEAAIPGLVLDRKTVHFLPLEQLPADLTSCGDGFLNGSGERVIPVLRRPSLHDLRRGESWRALRNTFTSGKKLLIITEEFGSGKPFSRLLADACRQSGWEPEILCWKNTTDRSGSKMLESIPDLLRNMHGSPAETVLLIPPAPARDAALPQREQLRLNALLLEKLRSLSGVRKIFLATPLPDREESAPEYRDRLQTLAREYGAQWVDWGKLVLHHLPDYRNMFREDTSSLIRSLPDRAAEDIAVLLPQLLPRQ